MKRGYNLTHFLAMLLMVAIASTIASSFSTKMLQLTLLESLLLIVSLLLMVFPIGKRVIQAQSSALPAPLSMRAWLGRVFAIQLGFYLLMYAMAAPLFTSMMPEEAIASQGGGLFLVGLFASLLYQGLHPWPLIACLSVGIGILGASQQQEKISGIVRCLFTRMPPPAFFSAIDIASTLGFILWVMAMLAVMLFQLSHSLQLLTGLPALEFGHYSNVYICGVITLVLLNKHFLQWLARITSKSEVLGPMLNYLFLSMAGLMVLGLGIFACLPIELKNDLSQKFFVALFVEQNYRIAWLLISWSLGVCLAPSIAAWLQQISHGKTARQVFAALLFLPLVVAASLYWLSSSQLETANELPVFVHSLNWLILMLFSPLALHTLPLLIFAGFLYLMTQSQTLNTGLIQLTANQAGKTMRRYRRVLLSSASFLAWFLLLFLYTGISGMQFMLSLAAILVSMMAIPLPIMGLLKHCRSRD